MKTFRSKTLYVFLLFLSLSCSVSRAFQSLDQNDERGRYDSSNYKEELTDKGELTEKVVKKWLKNSSALGDLDKKELSVKEVEIEHAAFTSQLFFIKSPSEQFALKVYGGHCQKEDLNEREAKKCSLLAKSDFLTQFSQEPDLPQLAADLWTGFYIGKDNKKHYLSLMPKAPGVLLGTYLKTHENDKEKILAVIKRVAQVYGNAHAKTLLKFDEETLKEVKSRALCWAKIEDISPYLLRSRFIHDDAHPHNIFVDVKASETSEKSSITITLIDLCAMGDNLEGKVGSGLMHDANVLIQGLTNAYYFRDKKRDLGWIKEKVETFVKSYVSAFKKEDANTIKTGFINEIKKRNTLDEIKKRHYDSDMYKNLRSSEEAEEFISKLSFD